ncbi:MAG: hypothetical protein K9I59_07590 [Chlorobium sp.]|uniref:hypothetical protein n=1 Tax=Chlorobium sp. TaxID=1095 RepID=UPI0025BECD64|nr:hypothetical protein [Chlorobium sp.]MCF8216662.1 hypothetical protein [Chlorobium sp.]MCF8271532.1 hypothetical protein [Chlorobium sp.]MCF8287904.1 hypothetical protein [Chlorobium sp.]MCF8291478.1 hypothetical protein [Chlorobium sp.]MCF8385573.1 hypothetical protein [Chlorobium sp.]
MLKDAAAAAGGAILLTPLGMPFVMHGVAGMLVGGAGLFVADSLLKQVLEVMDTSQQSVDGTGEKDNAPDKRES